MKLHNEIQEQKSKKDRAHRELKLARQSAKTKVDSREFFTAYEVILKFKLVLNILINYLNKYNYRKT